MDFNSIIGIIIALTAVFGGQMLEGGHPGSLIQLTSFAIVLGGTLGAVLLQSPLRQFVLGMKMSRWIFVPPLLDPTGLLEHIAIWSSISRKEGLLALDTRIEGIDDPFIRKGLQLVVDGTEPLVLKQVLEVEIETFDDLHRQGARVWEAAGGYAPTIGILGAVMGLIQVMENLSDPTRLGAGIAVAFVLAMGISRVYLGAHYPSDVLGGYAAGAGWAAICVGVRGVVKHRRDLRAEAREAERSAA